MEVNVVENIGGLLYVMSNIGDDIDKRLKEYEVERKNNQITEETIVKYVSGFLVNIAKKSEENSEVNDFFKKVGKQFLKDYVADRFFGEQK